MPWDITFLAIRQPKILEIFHFTLGEWKHILWYLQQLLQQSTVFWVSETHLCVQMCVWASVGLGGSSALLKMPKECKKWDFLRAGLTPDKWKMTGLWEQNHHHFHHSQNHQHQHRHRVNKRAYSSYIRNAIPLWRTLCQHFVRKSLCKTMPGFRDEPTLQIHNNCWNILTTFLGFKFI